MLTLIIGTDPYLVHEAAHGYVDTAIQSGTKVAPFEPRDSDDPSEIWHALTGEISSGSLFSEKRMVVVWRFSLEVPRKRRTKKPSITNKESKTKSKTKRISDSIEADPLAHFLNRVRTQTSLELVLVAGATELPSEIIDAATHRIEVAVPTGAALRKWIADRALGRGVTFSPMVVDALLSRVGTDFWRLANEIEKLVSLGSEVTVGDVERLVVVPETMGPYDVIDAVARRDIPGLLAAMHRALRHGEQPIVVLSTILYQIRILLIVQDAADHHLPEAEIIAAMKLHPYVISKARAAVRAWSRAELEQWFHQLAHLEWSIKKQQVDGAVGLDLTILSLMQARQKRAGARPAMSARPSLSR